MQFIVLAESERGKKHWQNNYGNIRRPGLIDDGELVEASELGQLRHFFLHFDELPLDLLPSETGR